MWCIIASVVLCWIAGSTATDVPERSCDIPASSALSPSLLQTSSHQRHLNAVETTGQLTEDSLQNESIDSTHKKSGSMMSSDNFDNFEDGAALDEQEGPDRDRRLGAGPGGVQYSRNMMSEEGSFVDGRRLQKSQNRRRATEILGSTIDFVYCWAGETVQSDTKLVGGIEGHNSGYGYDEMSMSLRSLQKFASWFNKAYILVNGPAKPPSYAANDERIVMVDRCDLFPKKKDCPTNATAACQSVLHRVPHLKEKFVYMEDDWILLDRVLPSDFFTDEGKPLLNINVEDGWLREVYTRDFRVRRVAGPDTPPAKLPLSIYPAMMVHAPIPMLVSFSKYLEKEYEDWFAFVRSHRTRFVCCDAKKFGNGLEDLLNVVYPAMLFKTGVGAPIKAKIIEPHHHTTVLQTRTCGCSTLECISALRSKPQVKCVALQNCMRFDDFKRASEFVLNQAGLSPI